MNFAIDADRVSPVWRACVCVRPTRFQSPTRFWSVRWGKPLLQVVDEACIRCGECLPACPHDAVRVSGEIGRALAIAAEGDGVLILSPESAAHFYPATPEQVINACYAAGSGRSPGASSATSWWRQSTSGCGRRRAGGRWSGPPIRWWWTRSGPGIRS